MACEAIPDHEVDKSPRRWNEKIAVVDGSNVVYWGDDKRATLDAVKVVLEKLKEEDIRTFVVFDANIGFKATDRHLAEGEVKELIGGGVDVEIVEAGTVADRRIVSIAERENAVIVSNDLFKDSRRARHIPKRRGFYIAEYGYAELLPFSRA